MSDLTASKIQSLLSDPFESHDIEWRVQQSGLTKNQQPWVMVIPYVTNRAIQQRLDEVVGVDGWENILQPSPCGKGYLCGLKVRIADKWVTKWDGAEYTNVEALKGAVSGSMKRAAVQFGIGRYLYSLSTEFANCQVVDSRFNCTGEFISIPVNKGQKNGPKVTAEWFPPQLPDWALPKAPFDSYLNAIEQAETLEAMREAYEQAYKFAAALNRKDLRDMCVSIKDKRKSHFDEIAKNAQAESKKKFITWFNKALESISDCENESVLNQTAKQLITELDGMCRAKKVSSKSFVAQIKQAQEKRLNQLNDHCGV